MKKRIIIAVLAIISVAVGANAQQAICPSSPPKFLTHGSYNSSKIAGGTATIASVTPTAKLTAPSEMPLYTKKDTVSNTGVDTFKNRMTTVCNSVYTWIHTTGISGTNTSCVAKLWVSADSGFGTDFVPVYTCTVSATNPVGYHLFNSGNGFPYLQWWWTFQGAGTHSTSWYSGFTARYKPMEAWEDTRRMVWLNRRDVE